jgi:cysteine desulfurase
MALDEAHERIASAINAGPREVVLTSGGTEALNLALKGAAWAGKGRGHRILTTAVEHHAVLHPLRQLEKFWFEVVELPVDRYGRVDPDTVEAAITDRTILVAVQHANNEVGTVQPIARSAAVRTKAPSSRRRGPSAPYLDRRRASATLRSAQVDGPKGAGALYLRHGTHILGQQQGGTQERYRRAGTEDVAAAVGMGVAVQLAAAEREAVRGRLRRLRDRLKSAVLGRAGVELTGHPKDRLPGLLSVVVGDVDGAAVVIKLDLEGIGGSVGSACTTGSTDPSHVLTAMGYPDEEARGSLRLSLGRTTTEEEIDTAIDVVPRVLDEIRAGVAALAADAMARGALA